MGSFCLKNCKNATNQEETILLEENKAEDNQPQDEQPLLVEQKTPLEQHDDFQQNDSSDQFKTKESQQQEKQEKLEIQEKQDNLFQLDQATQDKHDLIIEYLSNQKLLQSLIQQTPLQQLFTQDQSMAQLFPQLDSKDFIWLCYAYIDRMHFNESEYPLQFRGLLPLAKLLSQSIYKNLETGVKALCLSQDQIQDLDLVKDILYILIQIDHILSQVMRERSLESVWWLKDKSIVLSEVRVKESVELYTHEMEQQLIRLSGRLKREMSMYHKDVRYQFQVEHQRASIFKYRAENTKARLKSLSEEEEKRQKESCDD